MHIYCRCGRRISATCSTELIGWVVSDHDVNNYLQDLVVRLRDGIRHELETGSASDPAGKDSETFLDLADWTYERLFDRLKRTIHCPGCGRIWLETAPYSDLFMDFLPSDETREKRQRDGF